MPSFDIDVTVVGSGPIGAMAALSLMNTGKTVALIGSTPTNDGRTTALMQDSCAYLKALGIWDNDLKNKSAALSTMQLIDGSKRLIRTPEIAFNASEVGIDAFGYNITNEDLNSALTKALDKHQDKIIRISDLVEDVTNPKTGEICLKTTDGSILQSKICIAADGRNSFIRSQADINTKTHKLAQTAIVLNLSHTKPHKNTSTEFHTETGPFTFVPMLGNQSSVVWVVTPGEAADLTALSKEELATKIFKKSSGFLGKIKIESSVQAYPLSIVSVDTFAKDNTFLIGEAAHAFPPIGAQGMNLGIRDIIDLISVLKSDQKPENQIKDYQKRRMLDIRLRTQAVDLLNRSLLSDLLPTHLARGIGLYALNQSSTLRKFAMRHGLGATQSQ